MMKTSGRVTTCCVALFFALTSVTAVQRLNSINDLKKINFGKDVPKHSLLLLYWFANIVDIDINDDIQLTFDPNSGDYGAHHYGNFERMLDPLPWGSGYKYYTVGNIYQETSMKLPPYIVHPQREYMGRNMDRIIMCVREQNSGWGALPRIDQMYITQHRENQRTYDPEHTYQITANLLRQIREFSVGQNQQQLLRLRNRYGSNADVLHIMNTWGDLACLGLLLFIVIQESHKQHNNGPEHSYRPANYNEPQINCRPEYNYRPQSNYRPEYDHRPQSNDRPEYDHRPQSNYRPQRSYISENRHRDWNDDGGFVACWVVVFVLLCLLFMFIISWIC